MKEINISRYTEEELRALMDEAYEMEEYIRLLDEANDIEYIMSRDYRLPMVVGI